MAPTRKERERAASKKYYWKNRDSIIATQREYDRDPVNRSRANERKKNKYWEDPEEQRRLARQRRASWSPERKAHEKAMAAKRYAEKKKVVVELVEVSESEE